MKNKIMMNALITLLIGLVLSVLVYNYTQANIQKSSDLELEHLFTQETSLIQRELDINIEVLASLGNLFKSQKDVTREQFKKFVTPSLSKYESIQALEWIPRIPDNLRAQYEDQASKDLNLEFNIKSKNSEGKMVREITKKEYFPVYYVEPLLGNLKAVGFDLSSSATRLKSLNQSIETKKSAATARIKLVQEKGQQFGFLVFLPVWESDQEKILKGFALGVYRVGDMLETALRKVKAQSSLLDIWLVDTTEASSSSSSSSSSSDKNLLYTNSKFNSVNKSVKNANISIEGRTWTLYVKPSASFVHKNSSSLPSVSFLVTFVMVMLIGYIISLKTLKAKELELLVKEKTQDLEKSYKEIENFNINLTHKVEEAVEENQQKDRLLLEQSKLAAMGEMIGAIAHQWRQPLNALAMRIQFIEDDFDDDIIDKDYIKEHSDESMKLVSFMSKTIDDFRNFFTIDKIKGDFTVKEKIDETVNMLSGQLNNHNISVEINNADFSVNGYSSEFQQVVLNIINNAKDAMIENEMEEGKIQIHLLESEGKGQVRIKDNAGGIPQDVIKRIFEPYYTTKEQGKGTGLGLYMSKMIIEDNMKGRLRVDNVEDGAMFIIEIEVQNE